MPRTPLLLLIGSLALAPAALFAATPAQPAGPPLHQGYKVLQRSCFKCHGEGSKLAELDLRTRESALKGGQHGPVFTPGKPEASKLYRMVARMAKPQMPPTAALNDVEVRAIRDWIAAGAPYPPTPKAAADSRWWAFRPVQAVQPPAIRDPWIRNPIDAFILAGLRAEGLRPSPAADRVTLIRRAYLDLHGLPPTPEEVDAFVADRSPDAWEKLVDRLLASPRYGERWARHWLDLARYAESEGFKADETRPNAWRYRDYVIDSFNADKPYDRFIREQIAGDEIAPDSPEALVATGFNRHWADESNARNIPLRRQEILNDITDTVGSVFLGMTVGCARCHDHKYDAISQKDYYRLQAFFAAAQPREDIPLASREAVAAHERAVAEWNERARPVREQLAALEAPHREKLLKSKRMPFPKEVLEAVDTPAARRTALQWQLFLKVEPQLAIDSAEMGKAMKGEEKTRWDALRAELDRLAPRPADLPRALGITDVGREAPKVHTLSGGLHDQPLEEVSPGFLSAVSTAEPRIAPPAGLASTGRRTALAEWLASPENPLTARVMVNRLWQGHFGQGLAPTASDLGKAGEAPTHPELLDWLATRFTRAGWSLKEMHRLLMNSAAYRQSSAHNAAAAGKDPANRLLWRYRRWRLEGEAVRDASLSIAGELNLKMHGPSIFPELPEGVSTRGGWPVTADPAERNRRSVYVFVRRNQRFPLFEAFDFPDTHEPCARRSVTNTAPQALMLFNSELALQPAQALAGRLFREAPTPEARIERAYRLAFGRAPETAERELAQQFVGRQTEVIRKRVAAGRPVALPRNAPQVDPAEGAAWVDFCHALLNANEFLYVD
jgi:mono/diheme cytochrome c family protein